MPYRLEPGLVRGLDYYTRTAFEFYIAGREGQQQALGGGGRYDGLVELLGGKPTPGIGFGIGLDRLVLALEEQGAPRRRGPRPAHGRRRRGRSGRHRHPPAHRHRPARGGRGRPGPSSARRKLGKQLESAARDSAHFAVIVGDELAAGDVQLRDLPAGTQKVVPLADLAREVARAHAAHRHGTSEGRLQATDRAGATVDAGRTIEASDACSPVRSRPASCDRHRRRPCAPATTDAYCDHACHHRDCDPTRDGVLIEFLPGRGWPDAVGLPGLHAGRGCAALPGLRADRLERPGEDGRLGLMAEWIYFIHPPRDDFADTMTDEEIAVWGVHFERFQRALADGTLILVGPTLGPTNTGHRHLRGARRGGGAAVHGRGSGHRRRLRDGELRPFRVRSCADATE